MILNRVNRPLIVVRSVDFDDIALVRGVRPADFFVFGGHKAPTMSVDAWP
jgi:hypothetical protein